MVDFVVTNVDAHFKKLWQDFDVDSVRPQLQAGLYHVALVQVVVGD